MPPKIGTSPPPSRLAFNRANAAERGEAAQPEQTQLDTLTTGGRTRTPQLAHPPGTRLSHAIVNAGATGRSRATARLEQRMSEVGVTLEQLERIAQVGGRYNRVAAHGSKVASFSDVAGFITVPVKTGTTRSAEKWPVVKDSVLQDGHPVDLYFVKAYGNRLVGMEDVQRFLNGETSAPHDAEQRGSDFKTYLLALSKASGLYARTRRAQGDRPVMQLPFNPRPFPRDASWANAEQLMHPFGPRPLMGAAGQSDFHTGYVDYNATENGIHFLIADEEKNHRAGRPSELRNNQLVPVSTNMTGWEVARLDGIKDIETMGPKGALDGVKLAAFGRSANQQDGHKALRILYENNAVHEVTFLPAGPRLQVVFPRPGRDDALAPLDAEHVDVSLLSYDGSNTGPRGSRAGYADPQLILANGDRFPVALISHDPTSYASIAKALAKSVGELLLLAPAAGNNPGITASVFNTVLQAVGTTVAVGVSAATLDHFRGSGTLVKGASHFSSSGAGTVEPQRLAGAVGAIVVLQNALTKLFDLAYETLLPQSVKEKETLRGQFVNELLLPFMAEVTRQMLNYGLEKLTGVPRGNYKDAVMLFATAAAGTLITALRKRSGNPENHPWLNIVGVMAQFVFGDLALRGVGSVLGNPDGKGMNIEDLREAMSARLLTRGYDKVLAPVVFALFNTLGWVGPNAGAHDSQLNAQNRQGILGKSQALLQELTTAIDGVLNAAWESASKNTGMAGATLHGTRRLARMTRQATDSLGIGNRPTNEAELAQVVRAKTFYDMTDPEQAAYLDEISRDTDARVAASAGASSGAAPIYNNVAELPLAMRARSAALLAKRASDLAGDDAEGPLYPLRPASNFLDPAVPYYATASSALGQKSERVAQAMTTFTREPVKDIKPIHDALAGAGGMPISGRAPVPGRAAQGLRQPTKEVLRGVENAVVKYTKQSGPFHYLQRWDETGQLNLTPVVRGIDAVTRVVNERGNVDGDPDKQVAGKDVLLVNFGALHGQQFAGPLMRAVVSEAPYLLPGEAGPENALRAGDLVSLTEIFSTTSSSLLAASFLAPQGFSAAAVQHRSRIVIDGDGHQPVATSIADLTELKQAETIFTPGTAFVIANVVRDPVKPGDGSQENLGQVVHFKRVNLWEMEDRYRAWQALPEGSDAAVQQRVQTGPDGKKFLMAGDVALEHGALMMHPETGNFFKFDVDACLQPRFHASKNYFLGTPIETDPAQAGRTRFPYTSEKSTLGMKNEINMLLFAGDSLAGYLDDMTKNIAYEIDKRHAGYYTDPTTPAATPAARRARAYRAADEAALAAVQARARAVAERVLQLNRIKTIGDLDATERAGGQLFPGHLLAQVACSALRQPLRVVAVDDQGKLERAGDALTLKADIMTGFDKVALQWDPDGPAMIGVGKHGYYAIQEHDGETRAVPIRLSGHGRTAGNLLHAIVASSTQPAAQRYTFKHVVGDGGQVEGEAETDTTAGMPGYFTSDTVAAEPSANDRITRLLYQLKGYVSADYGPMQKWLAPFDGRDAPAGRAPLPAPPARTGQEDENAISFLPPRQS
jgi:hypothetical protein